MLKKLLIFLLRCFAIALIVLFKIFLTGLMNPDSYRDAKRRAEEREENEYADSGFDPAFIPVDPRPTRDDFSAVKRHFF